MMADMGAGVTRTKGHRYSCMPKFKIVIHVVTAALRFQYVVRRKHQYIQSYSTKLEREKTNTAINGRCMQSSTRSTNSYQHTPRVSAPSRPALHVPTKSASHPKSKSVPERSSHKTKPTVQEAAQLSAHIPSLRRLQFKLNSTGN